MRITLIYVTVAGYIIEIVKSEGKSWYTDPENGVRSPDKAYDGDYTTIYSVKVEYSALNFRRILNFFQILKSLESKDEYVICQDFCNYDDITLLLRMNTPNFLLHLSLLLL